MDPRERSNSFVLEGLAHEEAERFEEAERCYLSAAEADPTYSVPYFNLGLLAKFARDWAECRRFNLLAAERDSTDQATNWNLGIASTALGDWDLARRAWKRAGVPVADGSGEIDFPCGFGPVRLDPDGLGEVVWGHRLDPARVRLASIPYPESGFQFGDIVLNDGAPSGSRMLHGNEVHVFDVLERLVPSAFETFLVEARVPHDADSRTVVAKVAMDGGGAAEDWAHSVRILCRKCSEGLPHDADEHDREGSAPPDVRTIAVAATSREHAERIVHAIADALPTVEILRMELAAASTDSRM